MTLAEINDRDFNEIEVLEKGGPIAIADYFIVNIRFFQVHFLASIFTLYF